jgi:hypothetical protein
MPDDFGTMVADIVNETRRSMSAEISNCILDAIDHYQTERFFFNEFSGSFSLSSSQSAYTSADASFIPHIMEIDTLRITVDSNYVPVLRKGSAAQFREYSNPNTFSQPTAYAYWGQSIIVDPAPDGGYAAEVHGVLQLASLSASTDANAWTQRGNGRELIKQRAKSILYSEYLRDDQNATRAAAREREALQRLRDRTNSVQASGEVTPCL